MKTMKRKIISLLTALFIFVVSASSGYAEGNSYGNYFGIIRDKDGNIVETIPFPMERASYVETPYTLLPGDTFTSYQYTPTIDFSIGFAFSERGTSSSSVVHTTRNRRLKLEIFDASSIGGQRRLVKNAFCSTNREDNPNNTNGYVLLSTDSISSSRPYYNGVITNLSSEPATVVIAVISD